MPLPSGPQSCLYYIAPGQCSYTLKYIALYVTGKFKLAALLVYFQQYYTIYRVEHFQYTIYITVVLIPLSLILIHLSFVTFFVVHIYMCPIPFSQVQHFEQASGMPVIRPTGADCPLSW